MRNDDYKYLYHGLSIESLNEEKNKLESTVRDQTAIWQQTNLAGSILLIVFGGILSVIIVGIPLLVVGIMGLVDKIKIRFRANRAINEANERIRFIDDLIRSKEEMKKGEEESIEAEIV